MIACAGAVIQCAWCCRIMSGERTGQIIPLLQEASHGVCDACEAAMRALLLVRSKSRAVYVQARLCGCAGSNYCTHESASIAAQ